MLLSGTSAAVAPGSGSSGPVPIIPRPPVVQAPELAPFAALDLASISNQASAIAWLSATGWAPLSSGVRQALPVARTAATQTSAMLEPPSTQPQLPLPQLEGGRGLPPAAAVAPASASPLHSPETSARPPSAAAPVDDAQPQQHPVLLMARLQLGTAVELDDAHQMDASVGTTEQVAGDGTLDGDAAAAGQQEERPIRRSDTFIGHRVLPAPNEAAWAEACAILSESPLVTTRPTTDQLLDAHLLTAKPLPRIQQWGLGRREQDRALTELKLALAGGPPPKRQGNYHRGPRTNKAAEEAALVVPAAATTAAVEASGDSDTAASAKAGSQQGDGEASGCARENDDDASSTVSADAGSRGPRRGVKRAREEDRPRAAAAAAAAAGAAPKGPKGAKGAKGPKVEVLEDDSILVDGVPVCAPGDPFYSRLFGLAQMEKHKDPEWHIASGIVDRCYYRGSKKEAKQRPGVDYFPTDQAMMADFVRRKPDVFITQVMHR